MPVRRKAAQVDCKRGEMIRVETFFLFLTGQVSCLGDNKKSDFSEKSDF
jgi:hypothetical protein